MHKIAKVDIDVSGELHRIEIKKFKILSNQVGHLVQDKLLESSRKNTSVSMIREEERCRMHIEQLIKIYIEYAKRRLKGQKPDVPVQEVLSACQLRDLYIDIFLAHLMNLFNADLLSAIELRIALDTFRQGL